MDKDDLLALIEKEESDTISLASGLLSEQRREALQYFYGEPYGNEIEGRSGVVTTEVRDAILGLLPIIMDIFTASDEIVRCDPQGPEDEMTAQQATDWLNYKFSRGTEGWKALYNAVFDALLQKNGYIKIYWEEYEEEGVEKYEGLTEDEFYYLQAQPDLELLEEETDYDEEAGTIEASFRRAGKRGKICIVPVPPEEILVSRDTGNDLEKARFVEHRKLMTLSEIRQMGYEVDDDIGGEINDAEFSLEKIQRDAFDDSLQTEDNDSTDPSMKRVWFREAYLRVDFDGNGIAEFRKVTVVGDEVLENEEFDSLPIVCGQVLMMPHKHYGLSIHDLINW